MARTRIARPSTSPVNGSPLSAVIAPEVVEPDDPVDLPPGVDGLESLMTELNGATQAKITVYRINKTGPNTYVYQCTPDAFSLDDLRDQHGGGEFRLYIMRDHEFFKNIRISVAAPKIIATAAAPNEPPAVTELRNQLAARDRQIEEFRMRNIRSGSILENLDLPATITAISAALVALRPPPPPPMPPPDSHSADRAIDMLLKGIELAKELKGDGDNETSMLGVLNNLVKSPMMAQAVASLAPPQPTEPAMPQQPRLVQPTQQPMARPGVAPPRPTYPQTGIPEFDAAAPMIARYLPLLCEKAKLESSSQLYAELILDSVPEDIIETILVHTTGEIVQFLALLHPGVGEESPWFVSMVDEMRFMLEPEPGAAPVEGEQPGGAAGPPA